MSDQRPPQSQASTMDDNYLSGDDGDDNGLDDFMLQFTEWTLNPYHGELRGGSVGMGEPRYGHDYDSTGGAGDDRPPDYGLGMLLQSLARTRQDNDVVLRLAGFEFLPATPVQWTVQPMLGTMESGSAGIAQLERDLEELAGEVMQGDGESVLVRRLDQADQAYANGGFGAVPASAASVAALETRRYGGVGGAAAVSGGAAGCVICIEDFEVDDDLSVMPCSYRHSFHRSCLAEWLARSRLCPLCRHALPAEVELQVQHGART